MDINACPKCGNIEIVETVMQSGPHYSRIDCPDCGFIKWGKKPREVKRMAGDKITFKTGLDGDKKVFVALGTYEFETLFHEYGKAFDEFCKMAGWFKDSNVLPENKIQFIPTLLQMIDSIHTMTKMVQATRVPDKVIAENLSLPF